MPKLKCHLFLWMLEVREAREDADRCRKKEKRMRSLLLLCVVCFFPPRIKFLSKLSMRSVGIIITLCPRESPMTSSILQIIVVLVNSRKAVYSRFCDG
jgi:hypothetical protein